MSTSAENSKMALQYIEPTEVELSLDHFTGLNYKNLKTGETFEDIQVKLMFPLSKKDHFLVLFNEDGEIGIIYSLDQLKPEYRQVVDEVLERRYFVPEITQVVKVEEKYRLVHWKVITDRGPMDFYTRTRHDIVVKGTRIYIRDIDYNRYLIRDYKALSTQSQRELSSEI